MHACSLQGCIWSLLCCETGSAWGRVRGLMLASPALIIEGCVQAGLASQQRRFHWDKRKRAYVQLQSGEQVKAGKRMRVESGALVAGKAQPSGMYQRWSRATQLRVAAPGDLEDPSAKPHANLANRCAFGPTWDAWVACWRRRVLSSTRGRWVAQAMHACCAKCIARGYAWCLVVL